MGGAADDVQTRGPAASVAGAGGREPAAPRRRTPGVAAADSRDRPRNQQLARADQVDSRQPGVDARRAIEQWRLAPGHDGRYEAWARRHRIALRFAQPLYDRLCA